MSLDFVKIGIRSSRNDMKVFPNYEVMESKDLMIRAGKFYAVWNEKTQLWSTKKDDLLTLIDEQVRNERNEKYPDASIMRVRDASTRLIQALNTFLEKDMWDQYEQLDTRVVFSNQETTKDMLVSKKLPYALEKGTHKCYDELIGTLFDDINRHKFEWAIGAIIDGASKYIQKFIVFYGDRGTGKSTVMNLIQSMFPGYCKSFEAKVLGQSNNSFPFESFKDNPLIAINHDGKLDKIDDNTRLNSLVSHEVMPINLKNKSVFEMKLNSFLFIGSNNPVKITESKSGLLRRLIDVNPTGNLVPGDRYKELVHGMEFEKGAIAYHCLEVYRENPNAYDNYVPNTMMCETNDFFNFMLENYSVFDRDNGCSADQAWVMYKTYCDDAKVPFPYPKMRFKAELKDYFDVYEDRREVNGTLIFGYYSGFKRKKFEYELVMPKPKPKPTKYDGWLVFEDIADVGESNFDIFAKNFPAMLATTGDIEKPVMSWDFVTTVLGKIDTRHLHHVKVPINHIIIDFDLKDTNGDKSLELNLQAALKFPPTYAELSKSGKGIHLHYNYIGDAEALRAIYAPDIEVKVYRGNASLRRKLTKCNRLPISDISSGLPLKEVKNVISFEGYENEKHLKAVIFKHFEKKRKHEEKTIEACQLIKKCLDEAYESGMKYDLTDIKFDVHRFAMRSTNNSNYCMALVEEMKFKSDEPIENVRDTSSEAIVFWDIEVFPNLFVVCWKIKDDGDNKHSVVKWINPTPQQIAELSRFNLIGFNNRKYDNHITYARMLGDPIEKLYEQSQAIINNKEGFIPQAYNFSYTDIFDYAATKQSLKKWEIELGIHHQELGLPWDQPVPEEMWETVADYCVNDVIATEAVFNKTKGDFTARLILAELAGMTPNDTTNTLTTNIIFGKEKNPKLVYTYLDSGNQTNGNKVINFPGYKFEYNSEVKKYCNMYRGTNIGFGGYIISNPGIYYDVALLDVKSMHPHSIIAMNYFGEYTKQFKDILDARIAIKEGDLERAKTMLNGRLAKYLDDPSIAKDLAQALKIAINSCYGLTSASFDNAMRHPMNKNNIVALRGALFMRTLQDEVESRGFKIIAIKTDSIKIANATKEIVDFCMDFARKYGYEFDHEAVYNRICQTNDADYIARYELPQVCLARFGYVSGENKKHPGMEWTATGKMFQIPYTFKTLFSHEKIEFSDLCVTNQVKNAIYLDFNEELLRNCEVTTKPEIRKNKERYEGMYIEEIEKVIFAAESREKMHKYHFVGKVGSFVPIRRGKGGGLLYSSSDMIKFKAVAGSSGYRWMEAEMVKELGFEDRIDYDYHNTKLEEAKAAIDEYGDFEQFASDYIPESAAV